VLADADNAIAGWRDDAFNELMPTLWNKFLGKLNRKERGDIVVALVMLTCCFILSFGLVFNLTVAGSIAIAWAISCQQTRLSPLSSSVAWTAFLTTHSSLRLFIDPLIQPVRLMAALLLTRYYRRAVVAIQSKLPYRETLPVLNRGLALTLAWALVNGASVASLSYGLVWLISFGFGVPLA